MDAAWAVTVLLTGELLACAGRGERPSGLEQELLEEHGRRQSAGQKGSPVQAAAGLDMSGRLQSRDREKRVGYEAGTWEKDLR